MPNVMEQINPRKFLPIFKGRTDRIAVYARGKILSQQISKGDFELTQRLEAHFQGNIRTGFYNLTDENTVRWAIVNFSQGGPSKNLEKDSAMLVRELHKIGFNGARRERTMLPQEDYNIWIFFQNPIPARKVRYFIFLLLEKLGLPKNLPVVPTVDELNPGSLDLPVWLPYFNGIDKWLDSQGNPYTCKGIKDDQTIFIGEDGSPLETNLMSISPNSEDTLDRAIQALSGPLSKKYIPGVGLFVPEEAFFEMSKGCVALKNIVTQIEERESVSEAGLVRLATLLRALGLNDLLNNYVNKIQDCNMERLEKALSFYNGAAFPTCLDLKQNDFCPAGQVCFADTAPLTEQMGAWREDPKMEKTQPTTNSLWFYKGVAQISASPSAQGAQKSGKTGASAEIPESRGVFSSGREQTEAIALGKFIDEYLESLRLAKEEFDRGKKEIGSGLQTGLSALDESLSGLAAGTIYILAGPAAAGKTSLAQQIFYGVAEKEKIPVAYISFDSSKEQLYRKNLARLSGIPCENIINASFSAEEWENLKKITALVKKNMGNLLHFVEGSANFFPSSIEKIIKDSGAKFLVIDPIQGFAREDSCSSTLDCDTNTRMILGSLKNLARKLRIPILALSNGKITPAVEYGADVILQIYSQVPPATAAGEKKALASVLNIEKNREGRSLISIQYAFYPPRMVFYGEKKIDYRPIKF